eukprot:SAG31_NODE_206_length_20335_cov_17.910160_17_plen_131_part_00
MDPAVERETIRREVAKLNRARLKILQQFVSSMKAASALAREHDTASLRHASMTQRLSAAENELREFGLQVDAVHEEFELVKEKWAEMKSDLSKAKASVCFSCNCAVDLCTMRHSWSGFADGKGGGGNHSR